MINDEDEQRKKYSN